MSKHAPLTPLPWFVYDRGIGCEIVAEDQECINREFRDTFSKEDAEFIVRACNCHGELLEALRRVISWEDHTNRLEPIPVPIADEIRAAIAKALRERPDQPEA